MAKKIRIAAATVFFICITLLLVGIAEQWFGWMAKLQFLPACLALNVAVIVGILLLTLVVGRIYCSVICPMGVFQDIIIWIRRKTGGKKFKYSYKKENKLVRYAIWLIFIACIIAGLQVIVALLAPYSAYGRIVNSIVAPHGWLVPVIAALTLVFVVWLAWSSGREYCNTICPVGTTLGLVSRFALFRPVIDKSMCVDCHACERACKSHCIDVENRKVDTSRCVDCFDCIDHCKLGALKYRFAYGEVARKPMHNAPDAGRRAFIAGSVLAASSLTLGAQERKLDGGLAAVLDKKAPKREQRITPPGSDGERNFYDHCTACQLCIANCPNEVLRPSTDLGHMMQPKMDFDRGFCRPECTTCSELCPAGAIKPISVEQKTFIHIGHAVVDLDLCLANSGDVSCGSCAAHCPMGAISMVRKIKGDVSSALIPTVIEDRCIGCGKCEFLCPSRPFSAIHVEGLKKHINE
ncbi:MAG: 4Fe-4S dicluster domain-containing protein [Rikenellaceae bacterium]|nr:4Fe-4S dicluster domain-containing protein [Rikenellaceae bacterium]